MHDSIDVFSTLSQKTLNFLHSEFGALQIGRASPSLVENISIDVYGATQPLKNLTNITLDGPQSILISPWDKSVLADIERAIRDDSSLGLAPLNDGNTIRLNIPPLTEERRKELTKIVSKMAEEAKITIRKHRHDALDIIKKDEDLSEDQKSQAEKQLQTQVEKVNTDIDISAKKKSEEILKI